ncbi:hypothetical protein [Winogradskyella forsetii]|uniref:hypothetical protein n=1 Tax=Winogradskyella forsetii TaxID=2686077 RepID=UPI0015BB710F|nr:hypothetical protein [Winogradskyella forsetii]
MILIFFGNYHAYISKEINYFRTHYKEKKRIYSKWRLFRSRAFFSSLSEESEILAYKEIYTNWVTHLNKNLSDDIFHAGSEQLQIDNRDAYVKHQIRLLAEAILPYIQESQSVNKVIYRSRKIIAAYNEMTAMKSKIRDILEKDIKRFEHVLSNMQQLLEHKVEN